MRRIALVLCGALVAAAAGFGQSSRQQQDARIDVDSYVIDAQINPDTQTITARAAVRFIPLDDQTTSATFELNNNLNISRLADEGGDERFEHRQPRVSKAMRRPAPNAAPLTRRV